MRDRYIDQLLLSIIRAYDHPKRKADEERLASARDALFGAARKSGRVSSSDDLAVFRIQAELRKGEVDGLRLALSKLNADLATDRAAKEAEREPRSARAAAKKYSYLAGTRASDDSTIDRLRRKSAAKQFDAREMAELENLLDPEAPHTRNVVRILELLDGLGVRSETIWDENC